MGDRTTRFLPCPKCGKETEQYDAPSSLLWVWHCKHCNWEDDRDYYESDRNTLILCTKEEARKNGGLVICPKCKKEVMGSYLTGEGCLECLPATNY